MLIKSKKLSILFSFVACLMFSALFLSSCATKPDTSTESPASTSSPAESVSDSFKKELYQVTGELLKQNYDLFFNIFSIHQLELDIPEKNAGDATIFPVKDDRFKTYSELESYVRSTYISSTADNLLAGGMYVNRDGKLFGDLSKQTGGGYYVDWNNYEYEVSDIKVDSAIVTIRTTENAPNVEGTDKKTDVTLTGIVVKENGKWLLQEIIQ
jgi:hypothetical protein